MNKSLLQKRKPGVDPKLFGKESLHLAMLFASMSWPGITISDGAFDILRQVAEYQEVYGHDG